LARVWTGVAALVAFGPGCALLAPFDPDHLDADDTGTSPSPPLRFGEPTSAPPDDGGGGDAPDDEDGPSCAPSCEGRACGGDGCGGACPLTCGIGEACGTDGQCVASCAETFRVDVPASRTGKAVLSDGWLYVTGARSGVASVSAYDACGGGQAAHADVAVGGASGSWLSGLVVTADGVLATGSYSMLDDPGHGLYVRLARDDLHVEVTSPLWGSDERDDLAAIGLGPNDRVWMGGQARIDTAPSSWMVEGSLDGDACGFGGPAGTTLVRAILANEELVVVAADGVGVARIVSYDAECRREVPCSCPEGASSDLAIGSQATVVLALAVVADRFFAAGLAQDEGAEAIDQFGFVAELDTSTGEPLAVFRWNASATIDGFAALATNGDHLYAAGARGWDGSAEGFGSAHGAVVALPLDLGGAEWVLEPPGANVVWGVAADEGSVYASGDAGDGAFVAKCTTAGLCE